jgi:hypothetical protein
VNLDKDLPPDIVSVLNAAAMLDITEYEVFQLAWLRWHGKHAEADSLEPHFVAYMFHRAVPPWVRHFARLVEERFEREDFHREHFGVARLQESRRMVSRGMRYSVIVALALVGVVWLAQVAAELAKLKERCIFPPCY